MIFLNKKTEKFDFKDFSIIPETTVNFQSRNNIDIFTKIDDKNFLPIIIAPMDTVLDNTNYFGFYSRNCQICMPRKPEFNLIKGTEFTYSHSFFYSYSLKEFKYIIENCTNNENKFYLLVDIANGHLASLLDLIPRFKMKYKNSILMVGNIANPNTFKILADVGADYVRLGIGAGSACTTSANTSIHYPIASLIADCYEQKVMYGLQTKIVADGGFKNFDDLIKALALGADFLMSGSIFNKTIEACGQAFLFKIPISNSKVKFIFNNFKFLRKYLKREYRGMSTKKVQREWGKEEIKTSEGIETKNNIEYSLSQWLSNFSDYLRSAMSYTNSKTLEEFKIDTMGVFITDHAYKRFSK